MSYDRAFRAVSNTVTISVTNTSAVTTLPANPGGTRQLRVYNASGTVVFMATGEGVDPTATVATSLPITPGGTGLQFVTIPPEVDRVAFVAGAAGPFTVYLTVGVGSF